MGMIPAQAVEAAYQDENANPRRAISPAEIWAILEAAAPHIRAQALEEAADKFGEAASWSDSRPSPEQIQRWLRAGAAAERGSSGND